MTEEDIIRKGNKSELLLQDEVFTDALQQLQDIQVYKWKSSLPHESAKREQAWAMLQSIDMLKTELKKMIDNGWVERKKLERTRKLKELKHG
jgi:predicted nucleotide-binding protein (sugar kinase/HSP70/actin superfamily)